MSEENKFSGTIEQEDDIDVDIIENRLQNLTEYRHEHNEEDVVEGEAKYIDDDTMFELNFHIKGMKAFTQDVDEYKTF